jgi:hypothetical protein
MTFSLASTRSLFTKVPRTLMYMLRLISVVYHALQAMDTYHGYERDAEEKGDNELTGLLSNAIAAALSADETETLTKLHSKEPMAPGNNLEGWGPQRACRHTERASEGWWFSHLRTLQASHAEGRASCFRFNAVTSSWQVSAGCRWQRVISRVV